MGILLSKQEQGLLNLLEELFSSHDWITFSELAKNLNISVEELRVRALPFSPS